MVQEHHNKKFDSNWISQTFAFAAFGNGLIAIISGLLASGVELVWGTVAPFDLAIVALVACGICIARNWTENYGSVTSHSDQNLGTSLCAAVGQVVMSPELILCGIIQSLFESSMYGFVFMWTPAMPDDINHGIVFACFMAATMLGSGAFSALRQQGCSLMTILMGVFLFGGAALSCPIISNDAHLLLGGFIVFEMMCGVYFASFYALRSEIVPDRGRATILNLYRVPMNILVLMLFLNINILSTNGIFGCCVIMMGLGFCCTFALYRLRLNSLLSSDSEPAKDDVESIPLEIMESTSVGDD